MKELRKIQPSLTTVSKQLKIFKSLLDHHSSLGERELLDFFKHHEQLIPSMVSQVLPQLSPHDYIAREYDLFGDFTCDFVIGNKESRQPIYCVVEFEDARPESIFKNKPGKHTSEWSPRFEQGFFQLVDWFHQLDDLKPTTLFRNKFGENPEFYGLLVIGRNQFLNDSERRRLNWCSGKILINSCKIYCKTFDDLYDDMAYKYRVFADQVAFLKAV
jgi:hypothetical protein